MGGAGLPNPPSRRNSPNVASSRDGMDNETGTESTVSHRRERARRRNREEGERPRPRSPGPTVQPRSLLILSYCLSPVGVSGEQSQARLPGPR